jgi:hypothetical protein
MGAQVNVSFEINALSFYVEYGWAPEGWQAAYEKGVDNSLHTRNPGARRIRNRLRREYQAHTAQMKHISVSRCVT